ncbi:MAG: tetratricopeptide repeat protein [Pirellulaceae bacterium]
MNAPELATQSYVVSAEAVLQPGDRRSAANLLQQALAIDANYVDAHRLLAAIYYDQGLDDLTVQHLTFVSQLAPGDPKPDRQMGLMCLEFQDYDTAITHYTEALRRNPPLHVEVEIRQELAQAYVKTNQSDKALENLDTPVVEAFANDPQTPPSLLEAISGTRAEGCQPW